jgi:hypothetical protein
LYHSPRTFLSFDVLCASLEVLFPSAFSVSGACIPQAFRAWHSPLLRFLIASAALAPRGLSSLFHLETLMGFSFRAFSCQRLVAPSCAILSRFGAPSAFYRWLLHAHDFVIVVSIRFLSTTLQFDFRGLFPLTARSIGSGVSRLQWPMLSWFSILFRGFVSLCCALSILISIDVTPLLRRRLYGLQKTRFALAFARVSTRLCWLVPQYASSLRFFFCALCAAYPLTGSPHTSLTNPPHPPFY